MHNFEDWLPAYATTLHTTTWTLGLALSLFIHFDFFLDGLVFLTGGPRNLLPSQVTFMNELPMDRRAGTVFADLVIRAQWEVHVTVHTIYYGRPAASHDEIANPFAIYTPMSAASDWAAHIVCRYVMIFDHINQTLYVVAATGVPMLPAYRGGLPAALPGIQRRLCTSAIAVPPSTAMATHRTKNKSN
eukprot:5821052-Amphidinium_carterae.1